MYKKQIILPTTIILQISLLLLFKLSTNNRKQDNLLFIPNLKIKILIYL